MSTTITLKETTRKKLERLKKRRKSKSFNRLLDEIADKELQTPDSLFGRGKGLKENFEREREERI